MSGDENEEKEFAWSAHYDDEGRLYYYNSTTEESSWDPPEEGFTPLEEPQPDANHAETDVDGGSKTVDAGARTEGGGQWAAYKDDEGNEYFYNSVTGETQWERPEGEVAEATPDEDESNKKAEDADTSRPTEEETAEEGDSDADQPEEPMDVVDEPPEDEPANASPEPEIDPAVLRLQEARNALNKPDSVMEPSCIANVTEVVTGDGGNPQQAISTLLDNFAGQTAICGLASQWLSSLRRGAKKNESNKKENEDEIRNSVTEVIHRVAKEKFSKERGDGILDLSKTEAAFLESMMDSSRWRQLLIDLSAKHKDSAVLTYCLRAISKRGYHREIASRINQSDHFTVFNAMLSSELSIIGKLAVSNASDEGVIILSDIIRDLTKACSSTSYTYLYSLELLRHLLAKAKELHSATPHLELAIRKWEALAQELEMSMMDPTMTQSAAGSSTLFRKRRLDLSLTVSNLSQQGRKRRRLDSEATPDTGKLQKSLAILLQRHSVGVVIDDKILNSLLPSGLDLKETDEIGKLLVQYPLAIQAFLVYLYKPGSSRLSDPVMRNKCAKLLSLATIESEKAALRDAGNRSPITTNDELSLSRMILEGSQLCEQLETMVSFLVAGAKTGTESTAGQKLCALASECAPVAQGVIVWARNLTAGHEFAAAASFPTLSVSILSLVRLVAIKQPFVRREALQVALVFLKHSNSDISYQTITAIREQSLRLMIVLVVHGRMADVLNCVTTRLKRKQSDLDASLVRYFVGGVLEVVRPPYSVAFVRSIGSLLQAPRCLEAVRSSYFKDVHQKRLVDLLGELKGIELTEAKDISLVASLMKSYETGTRAK